MKINHYKKQYANGDVYFRSVCVYEDKGVKKQINIESFYPMYIDFFLNEIQKLTN